jgi:hypothetical protein
VYSQLFVGIGSSYCPEFSLIERASRREKIKRPTHGALISLNPGAA